MNVLKKQKIRMKNSNSFLLMSILFLQNISIFFSNVVNRVTFIQIICLGLYLVYVMLFKEKMRGRCGQFLGPKGTRRRKTWHIRNKKKNELSPYMMN